MYKATAGWICLDTLVHDALLVVSSYYIIQAALRHPESPMIQKDFPHGPCISAGTTTNSSPGVAHGASRTSPGQGYGAWGSGAMGAIHTFLLITSLGIIIIFNMVGKSNRIETCWKDLKSIEASNQNVFGPCLDCFAWSCSKYLGTPAVAAWHRSWPQIEMRPVAAFTEPLGRESKPVNQNF